MGMDPISLALITSAVGMVGASVLAPKPKTPDIAASTPPPQASQVPDANGVRTGQMGTGQGGGQPGVAQTFLTGAGGVDPSTLKLGKNTLLGGGG